ncbi:MAG TPA: hypothetical protein VF941_19045 [Clostridia bacterium]
MKRVIFACVGAITVIIGIALYYFFYLQSIDTKFAIKYSQVFGSYDINQVDQYLNKETIISYKGLSGTYGQLRNNVISAFKEHKFKMADGSSYGSGNDKFINGVQEVNIQSYVIYKDGSTEVPITMQLEKNGINKFTVKSLSNDDDFFGYLFFGIKNKSNK